MTTKGIPWLIVAGLTLTVVGLGYTVLTADRAEHRSAGAVEAETTGTRAWLRAHVLEDESSMRAHEIRLGTMDESNARQDALLEVIREGQTEIRLDIKEILRRLPRSP